MAAIQIGMTCTLVVDSAAAKCYKTGKLVATDYAVAQCTGTYSTVKMQYYHTIEVIQFKTVNKSNIMLVK